MEVFTNCATAIASFAKFYLLLNGSGVGRSYDDELVAVDWAHAPDLLLYLSPTHPDYPRERDALCRFAVELACCPAPSSRPTPTAARALLGRDLLADLAQAAGRRHVHASPTAARAGRRRSSCWKRWHSSGARGARWCSICPTSAARGAPIRGMQGRPASGPISLLRAFLNIRRHVIEPARARGADCRCGSRRCWSTTTSRSRCRSAAPAAPPAWRRSAGATPASSASSAASPRAACGPPTTRSWWIANSGGASSRHR